MELVIRTAKELEGLRHRAARRGIDRVTLELGLRDDETHRLETSLNRRLRSCGCEMGAVFVAVGLAAHLAAALLAPGPLRWPSLASTARFMSILLALALVGKILGLVVAEWRLRQEIVEAVRRLNDELIPA